MERFGLGLRDHNPMGALRLSYFSDNKPVPLQQWVHLATTYDGAVARVYVNAIEMEALNLVQDIEADLTPLSVGCGINEEQAIENLRGKIDDLRLYSRALTINEIQALAGN